MENYRIVYDIEKDLYNVENQDGDIAYSSCDCEECQRKVVFLNSQPQQKLTYEEMSVLESEKRGVYCFTVKKNKMIYYSYFGSEGIFKVTVDLDTLEEKRNHQKTTRFEYNYFCG